MKDSPCFVSYTATLRDIAADSLALAHKDTLAGIND